MDLPICGTELAKGGICKRSGNRPDGKCYQHCAPEYKPKVTFLGERSPPPQKKTLSPLDKQREFENNLVHRMRSMLISNLRESEERMSKVFFQQVDELRINNKAQERLLSFYEKIIQEKVSPEEFKDYVVSFGVDATVPVRKDPVSIIREDVPVDPPSLAMVLKEDQEDVELTFEEKEKLYSKLLSESMQHSEEGVLPVGFMERYKLLFPRERRKNLFTVSKLIPPSQERDAELLAYYERKKEKGLIKSMPGLEDIPGSTKYKPYVEKEEEEEEEEEREKGWAEKFTSSAFEGAATPCVHCKVGRAPPDRVSCNDCYVKLWRCKAFSAKGEPCQSFASQCGPYCKRHIGYQPKTEKK
ncbi:hypothetical protein [Cedratvirus kamchatka]|uniref:Uncharacterized protein n=1 Tax=Cedratvirus kamchatka TaxID=2716914 RepID=A0A6G8MXP6_9VIRU|nr:hypothetical protein [Cedratvirus kamchatka]